MLAIERQMLKWRSNKTDIQLFFPFLDATFEHFCLEFLLLSIFFFWLLSPCFFHRSYEEFSFCRLDEGLKLETSALLLFTVANLRYQISL